MTTFWQRMRWVLAALAATLLLGTAGFSLIERWTVFDAFYMALITITTVGYFEVHPLSASGRIFNTAYILVGVSVMFFVIGVLTQAAIEFQLSDYFGKRRVRRMIAQLKDHFVICGFGRVGRGAAKELQRTGAPFVVVDMDPDKVDRAMRAGMLAVLADSTRDETLKDVGIDQARGVIAALSTDADNLFLTLSAKSLNPQILVSTRVAEEEAEKKLRRAGADAVLAPYSITGSRLAQALLKPHVTQFLDFTTSDLGDFGIEQVQVGEGSELVARSLKELQLRREVGVIVLAIRQSNGQMLFNPPAEASLRAGDCLIVMGQHASLRKLERLLAEVPDEGIKRRADARG